MTDYNSKYRGEQVEALLDKVVSGIPVYVFPFTTYDVLSSMDDDGNPISIEGAVPISELEDALSQEDTIFVIPGEETSVAQSMTKTDGDYPFYRFFCIVRGRMARVDIDIYGGYLDNISAIDYIPENINDELKSYAVEKRKEEEAVYGVADGLIGTHGTVYALPDEATGYEDDVILTKTKVRTINGESIAGEGDIIIEGGIGEVGPQGPQGEQGPKGDKGDKGDTGAAGASGKDGVTFTPSIDADGNLSWTNDGGLPNPTTVNIKGPKGDKGDSGSGGGGGGEYAGNYPMVYHDILGGTTITIAPNTYNILTYYGVGGDVVEIELETPGLSSGEIVNEYVLRVDGGLTLALPANIMWANNVPPTFEDGSFIEISIIDGLAVFAIF